MVSDAKDSGRVIWITGMSGSGKTTLAKALQKNLPGSVLLDGDDLREALGSADYGFDVEGRKKLAETYSRIARLLARQGFTALVATISLFHDLHDWNRKNLPGYFEIFLDIPEDIRRKRDPKKLYAANTSQMVGGEIKAELPLNPHLRLCENHSLEEAVRTILEALGHSSDDNRN